MLDWRVIFSGKKNGVLLALYNDRIGLWVTQRVFAEFMILQMALISENDLSFEAVERRSLPTYESVLQPHTLPIKPIKLSLKDVQIRGANIQWNCIKLGNIDRYLCFSRHCTVVLCRSSLLSTSRIDFSNSYRGYSLKLRFRSSPICWCVAPRPSNGFSWIKKHGS
jgi:hypothetical protein